MKKLWSAMTNLRMAHSSGSQPVKMQLTLLKYCFVNTLLVIIIYYVYNCINNKSIFIILEENVYRYCWINRRCCNWHFYTT